MENGKIEKNKLEKKYIFNEKIDDNTKQIKFAIPNVKAGSVIEYKYTKVSPFYYELPEWYFQRSIPVVYSSYEVTIPEYFLFNVETKGYESVSNKETTLNRTLMISDRNQTANIPYSARNLIFTAENLPAMKADDYVWNIGDYMSSVRFELTGTRFPGTLQKNYSSSWEDIEKTLQSSSEFTKNISRKTSFNDEIKSLKVLQTRKKKLKRYINI